MITALLTIVFSNSEGDFEFVLTFKWQEALKLDRIKKDVGNIDNEDACDDDDDEEDDDAVSRWAGQQLFPAGVLFPVPSGGAQPYHRGIEVSLTLTSAPVCRCMLSGGCFSFAPPPQSCPEVGPPGTCDKGDKGFFSHSCFFLSAGPWNLQNMAVNNCSPFNYAE